MRSRPQHGPVFVVVGVFDGLHLGHAYLLDHLVAEAAARDARPTVITFDHHPDEVLIGHGAAAPARPARSGSSGSRRPASTVTVVQHFDEALRQTPYDAFVERIRARVAAHRLPDDARRRVRVRAPRDAGDARRARARATGSTSSSSRRSRSTARRSAARTIRDGDRRPATSRPRRGCSAGRSR